MLKPRLPKVEKKRAFIYTRVSTDAQVIKGQSLETQKSMCMKWIDVNDEYEFKGIFVEEGITGKKESREQLDKLRQTVKSDDVIVLYSLHRLARRLKIWTVFSEEMKKKGVRIICISESIDTFNANAELMGNIIASISQNEVQQTSERTRHTMQAKRGRGELCNGKPPYGYGIFKALNGVLYSYPDLEEQKGISVIISHKDAGKSWLQIGDYLKMNGYSTKKDKLLWSKSTLFQIYKREKENRRNYPQLKNYDQIAEYEKYKAPHIVPYEQLHRFVVGKEFSHEKYNSVYNPKGNYSATTYISSLNQFKSDLEDGHIEIDEQTKAMIINDVNKDRQLEFNDPEIVRIMANPVTRDLYLKATGSMNFEEKKRFAVYLLTNFSS